MQILAVAGVMLLGAGILLFGIAVGLTLNDRAKKNVLTPEDELAGALA